MKSLAFHDPYNKYVEYNALLMCMIKDYFFTLNSQAENIPSLCVRLIKNLESINPKLESWAEKATPFFLANLAAFICSEEKNKEKRTLHLFFSLVDSYFIYIEPFKISLKLERPEIICLPNFGGMLKAESGELLIEKTINQALLINGAPCHFEKITLVLGDSTKLLIGPLTSYQELFSLVDFSHLSRVNHTPLGELAIYLPKLHAALTAISSADGELYSSLKKIIKFFVPLMDMKDHSTSFTLRPYIGVIFLSFNTDILAIAENIIREYGNSLLNIHIKFNPIVQKNDACYYSPYVEQLSTPFELLANIFNFIIVIDFFSKCLLNSSFEKEFSLIKYRLNVQLNRLILAFKQTKKMEWTEKGNELIKNLYESFLRIKQLNEANITETPTIIFDHLNRWKKNHSNFKREIDFLPSVENLTLVE
jgi:hypothetical protein